MENQHKEVYFHEYCMRCKHETEMETSETCNECLTEFVMPDSHKPINFEEK